MNLVQGNNQEAIMPDGVEGDYQPTASEQGIINQQMSDPDIQRASQVREYQHGEIGKIDPEIANEIASLRHLKEDRKESFLGEFRGHNIEVTRSWGAHSATIYEGSVDGENVDFHDAKRMFNHIQPIKESLETDDINSDRINRRPHEEGVHKIVDEILEK